MQKPVLKNTDFMKILDFGQAKFMEAKALPPDTRELRVYLVLMGLKRLLDSMKLELPFELEDLDKERPDVGGLDEIG